MPVIDHPIHEKTVERSGAKWGCHNRERYADGYYAPNRSYRRDGTFANTLVWIDNAMTKTCKNDIRATDPKCAGCVHR